MMIIVAYVMISISEKLSVSFNFIVKTRKFLFPKGKL
jgi:hypothetical protein